LIYPPPLGQTQVAQRTCAATAAPSHEDILSESQRGHFHGVMTRRKDLFSID
jgi:hypothetical protein